MTSVLVASQRSRPDRQGIGDPSLPNIPAHSFPAPGLCVKPSPNLGFLLSWQMLVITELPAGHCRSRTQCRCLVCDPASNGSLPRGAIGSIDRGYVVRLGHCRLGHIGGQNEYCRTYMRIEIGLLSGACFTRRSIFEQSQQPWQESATSRSLT